MDELVAGGGEGLRAGGGAETGHVPAGVALAVEQPPLDADAAAHVFGVVGVVGIEGGVRHVHLPLVELHHEGLDRIVAAGVGGGEADGRIVVGFRLLEHGLRGIDAGFGRLQRGGVFQRGGDGVVQRDGADVRSDEERNGTDSQNGQGWAAHPEGSPHLGLRLRILGRARHPCRAGLLGEMGKGVVHERTPFLARMQFKMVSERRSPREYQTSLPRRSAATRPARSIFLRWPETAA